MKNWFKVFFLFLLFGLLVYSNSWNNKLLLDDSSFVDNPITSQTKFIFSLWNPFQNQAMYVPGSTEGYRPLTYMVYNYSYSTFKNHYWKYHLLIFLTFALASSLVYVLIAKLTGNPVLAFLTGLFYFIHPINGDVVNYFPAGVCAFQLVFMLGSMLLLWESLERNNNQWLYCLSLLLTFISLFWHERGVMFPFYLSAAVLLFRPEALRKKALYLLPYFLIIFAFLVIRLNFVGIHDNVLGKLKYYHMNFGEYLASLFQAYAWYIRKLFYPRGIVLEFASPIVRDHIVFNVLGACLLPALFIWLFRLFSKDKVCRFGLAFILIGFAPLCLAVFRTPQFGVMIEQNWLIFSSIGFFILAARFCVFVMDRKSKAGLVFLFLLVFAWASMAHSNNKVWADQKTYALYWLKNDPYITCANGYLAQSYYNEGDLRNAEKYYRMMSSEFPFGALKYNNLGLIDQMEGHFKDAESDYKFALKINPYLSNAYYNLASVYYVQGQIEKAKEYSIRALISNPLLLPPRTMLASLLIKRAQYQNAYKLCLQNLEIIQDDPETLSTMIDIFLASKDAANLEKYTDRYMNTVADPEKLAFLGIHLAEEDAPQLALRCFTRSISLAPNYKEPYLLAGRLLMNLGKTDQAVQIWKAGSNIDPTDQRFKKDLAGINK